MSACPLEQDKKRRELHSRGNLNKGKERGIEVQKIDTALDKAERDQIYKLRSHVENGNRESEHEIERDHKKGR